MKVILTASDGSQSAERGVALAADLACAYAADLVIITAVPLSGGPELSEFSRAEGATVGDILEGIAQAHLAQARAIAEKTNARILRAETRDGDPAEVIMTAAREFAADVIVVGKRGQGRLAGLLLGSVSQKLVSLAGQPVLVVP
jgi:nucleotide-binding universal stress UspA family protein